MTIHSMGGREFAVACNGSGCLESRIMDGALREDVIAQLREEGWRCDKSTPENIWQHVCPECLAKAWRKRYGFKDGSKEENDDGAD